MNPKRYASEEFVQKYVDEHGGSGGRADWAQNDPDGAGYIENRPFYEEVTNTEILNATLNYDGYEGGYYHSFLTEGASPKSGASYTITINNDHEEIYTLGDDYTSTWYTYTDSTTGKIYNLFFGELWVGGIVITAEDGSTDPLSVVVNGTVNTIVSIEDKYLPQWVIETRTQASQAYSTANSKMNKTNPEGTGTLSVNRKSGTTTGKKSAAIGNSTTASGANSFAAGNSTTASGNSATAFGTITTASGANAIAGGMEAVASGANSFAIGATVEAQGYATFVSGSHSQALKDGSFAIGMGTVANAPYQHVQGRANLIDENNEYAHIVGNGTYTADGSKRANAHTLDWDGVPWYQGRPQFGGNAQDDGALQVLAEGEAVPVPPIAEVGQTMIITAVDEDGRPTEWEPIDVLMYDRENPPAGVENGVYVGPDSPQNAAKWQVLHEAELTEEATIVITGFDTTLSEYVMSLIVPKVTAKINSGNAHFLGARAFIYSQSFGNTNYASHYTYHGTMISGGRMLLVVYENNANSVGFDNDYSTAFQAAKGSGLACDVTKGIALKGAFPVGTKVRLEGR